jgi:hypothetical protein
VVSPDLAKPLPARLVMCCSGDHLFLEHYQARYGRLDTPLAQAGGSLATSRSLGVSIHRADHSPPAARRFLRGAIRGTNAAVPDWIGLDPITVHGIRLAD